MDADQPESFVAHVPVPSQEEVSSCYNYKSWLSIKLSCSAL